MYMSLSQVFDLLKTAIVSQIFTAKFSIWFVINFKAKTTPSILILQEAENLGWR